MVGFGEDEALIDFDERSHPAYRLLTEYFAFPEKFNFIDLPLPKAALSSFLGDQTSDDSEGMSRVFTLHVVLEGLRSDSDQARLLESVTARTFVLGCTPVVNLFQQNADPIRVTHAATEHFQPAQGAISALPADIDFSRGFGEGEEAGAEAQHHRIAGHRGVEGEGANAKRRAVGVDHRATDGHKGGLFLEALNRNLQEVEKL